MLLNKLINKLLSCRDSIYKQYLKTFFGVKIGNNTRISYGAIFSIPYGSLIIGDNCVIEPNVRIKSVLNINDNTKTIIIDNNVFISCGTLIDGNFEITIKKNTMIGPYCFITDSDHILKEKYVPIASQGGKYNATIIGENVWIGSHVQILRGAILGDNTIVAANSTILQSQYPDNVLLVGTPGKVKKKIFDDK